MRDFRIEPLSAGQRSVVADLLSEVFGSSRMVSRGELWDARDHPGFLALDERAPVGLLTYCIRGEECELTTLFSRVRGQGIGTALIEALLPVARLAGCRRLWLVTTNDNTPALRFYQKRGFRLAALYPNALQASRRLKPEIPEVGQIGRAHV